MVVSRVNSKKYNTATTMCAVANTVDPEGGDTATVLSMVVSTVDPPKKGNAETACSAVVSRVVPKKDDVATARSAVVSRVTWGDFYGLLHNRLKYKLVRSFHQLNLMLYLVNSLNSKVMSPIVIDTKRHGLTELTMHNVSPLHTW